MSSPTVHRAVAHDAARLHVSGRAAYVDDLEAAGRCLHLAFGLSTIARGKIVAMNLDAVKNHGGVQAVLTAADLPFANDVSPSPYPEPLLAVNEVHFLGQPVFLVVANSHRLARQATQLASIEYEEEEPLLDIDAALAANSMFADPLVYRCGDADGAMAAAAHRITGKITTGGQEHFYLEGQVAMATPTEHRGVMVQSSTQHPTEIQHKVADAIGVPMSSVRVEMRRMGGGFGGKESQGNAPACACAIAARLTGLPCRMRYDRDDDMVITGKRHDFRIYYEAGFDDQGRILAVRFVQYVRCGWSLDLSMPVADRAMLHADNAYHIPNMHISSYRLRTNTQSATAFRGFGGPQGMLGIERVLDHVSHFLDADPLCIRQRNFYPSMNSGIRHRTHYGMAVEDFVLDEIVSDLAKDACYSRRRADIRKWNRRNRYFKRGLALTPVKFGISFTLTHLNQAGALVHVYQDGSIHLNHGGTEMGQGLLIKVAQIAADAFGQPLNRVRISAADTEKIPNTSATAASSGTDLNGMAAKIACDEIVRRLKSFLAERHQVKPHNVIFRDGVFRVGTEDYAFCDTVKQAYLNRVSLSSSGHFVTPKLVWDRLKGQGRPFLYFAYGAAVTEVVIDTLTGENRVLRTDIIHDVGRSLNPAIDIGQIEGGFVQGMGWLTTEELAWDSRGMLTTHAPSTYKIPACSDRPRIFNVTLWQRGRNPENTIYRSKAVGEPPLMLANSVLLALSDAVAACGDSGTYPTLDTPATPERILTAIRRVTGEAVGSQA